MAGLSDFPCLPLVRGIDSLVITVQQQHDAVPIGVTEHPQQQLGVAQPELEQSSPELTAKR